MAETKNISAITGIADRVGDQRERASGSDDEG